VAIAMSESQPSAPVAVAAAPAAPAVQVAPAEWPTDPNSYDLIGKIGQGAFATVWKAQLTNTTTTTTDTTTTSQDASANASVNTAAVCAVKVLNLDHVDTNLAEIRLEVQAMRLSSHPNVLLCHTAFCNDTNLWLVTPLMTKGSSLHSLQAARRTLRNQYDSAVTASATTTSNTPNTPNTPVPPKTKIQMEQHILYILHETLLGLQYIHDNGQIHRDIKAGNILLDGNGDVRIADFGVSGWLVNAGSQTAKAKTFVGTPCWMAPEVMEQVHGYDYKADIWSLGITALELAKGYAPYAKYPPMKVLILTIQEDPPSLESYNDDDDDNDRDDVGAGDQVYGGPEEFSKAFSALVATCLQKNPARRPTCQELLQSKYLQSMNDASNRLECKKNIRTQVCNLVQDVGSQDANGALQQANANSCMPGNTPISIILQPENKDRPAGTTWVFADGSQVLSSSATAEASTLDDVMNEMDAFGMQTGGEHYDRLSSRSTDQLPVLEDNNSSTRPSESSVTNESCVTNTTDEADNRNNVSNGSGNNNSEADADNNESNGGNEADDNRKADDDDDDDDLNDFMDEFELNTAGEDFRR
jgi:serine/threonine-protein kinase OSR1/STK39